MTIRRLMRQVLLVASALLMGLSQIFFAVAQAQNLPLEIDIDPPVIDHEALESGRAGEMQLFSALVIDDRGIDHVDFYYRESSGTDYVKVPMKAVSGTANYAVTVPTNVDQSRIEYYLEAADTGGNRVLKGFPFFPLVRELGSSSAASADSSANASTAVAGDEKGNSTLLYIALGVLAVGVIAAAAGGGDEGGGGTPGDNLVPLTINVSLPVD